MEIIAKKNIDLSGEIAGIKLKNPVMPASGTFGLGDQEFLDFSQLGALCPKSVTLQLRPGNNPPRLVETPSGLINSIGLAGLGIDNFLAEELPQWLEFGVPVIVSIAGNTILEYIQLARKLNGTGIAGLEINVSCPNQDQGGMAFGVDPEITAEVVRLVREATTLPIIVKLTPNVTSITKIAQAAIEAGADALSAVNTFTAMAIDIQTQKPKIGRGFGGLSGPTIKPQALFKVWQICQAVDISVIGMGGISNAADAIEFFLAGASAVAVGTANFANPRVMLDVIKGIRDYLEEHNHQSLQEIIGTVKL